MSLLPANVGTGHVTGVFVNSDGQAETGKAWLRPRFTSAKITTAEPPTTVLPTPRSVQIGEDGRMAETEVVATSDPDLGLEAWTYEVTFKFDSGVSYGPFDIAVPEGETVDLTLVAPAATANGVQTIRGFGVPDPADAEDGDVVSYDATAGVTTWWSRSDAIGQAIGDEFEDPDSPLHGSIDAAVGRVTDEALESRLSRVDRTRHAPALNTYFPEAESAGLQGAIDAAAPTRGTVHLAPNASYDTSAQLNLSDGVMVQGGSGSRIVATASMMRLLQCAVADAVVQDVTIDAAGQASAEVVKVTPAATNMIMRRVTFTDTNTATSGLTVQGGNGTIVEQCTMDGLTHGVRVLNGPSDVTIRNNHIRNWSQRGIYILGTGTYRCDGLRIEGNRVTDLAPGGSSRYPIRIEGDDNNLHRDVTVFGNYVRGTGASYTHPTTPGTADQIALTHCDGLTVANNHSVDGGDAGMTISLQNRNVAITGNIIQRADATGLYVGSNVSVFQRNTTITDNVIMDSNQNRQGDRGDPVGIKLQNAHGVYVGSNILGNNQGSSTQTVGLHIAANCSNVIIGANVNAGNTSRLLTVETGAASVVHDYPAAWATKSTDTTRSNTATPADDPHLVIPLDSNATYEISGFLAYQSSTSADISFSWSGPPGMRVTWGLTGLGNGATSSNGTVNFARFSVGSAPTIGGSGGNAYAIPVGTLTTSQLGSVTLQWAQANAEAGNTILRANSYIKLTRVG